METSALSAWVDMQKTVLSINLLRKVILMQGEMAIKLINSAKVENPSGDGLSAPGSGTGLDILV
jgi:hypothetical protein